MYGLEVVGVHFGDRRAITFTIKREFEIAISYCRERDISCLSDLLRSEQKLSLEMRQFIADVLEGKPLHIYFTHMESGMELAQAAHARLMSVGAEIAGVTLDDEYTPPKAA